MSARMVDRAPRLRRLEHPVRAAVFGIVIVLALIAAFLAGFAVRSPERTALTAAQQRIPTTAAVERRAVDTRTTFSGTVQAGAEQKLTLPAPPERAVVTRQPHGVGDTLRVGDLIAVVSGSPIFALPAPLALYRDLVPGDSGDDVRTLQVGLRDSGFRVRVSGVVDAATTAAVDRLYQRAHLTPPHQLISASAFLGLSTTNARVTATAELGTPVAADTALVTLRTAPNVALFRADVTQAADVHSGQEVSLEIGDQHIAGTISGIGDFSGAGDGAIPGYDITVSDLGGELDALRPGTTLTIVPGTKADESLAVPVVAVHRDAAGEFVLRAPAHGEEPERVAVTVTHSGNGWAAISEGTLEPGDLVETGS